MLVTVIQFVIQESSNGTATSQDRNMLLNWYRSLEQHRGNPCLWSSKQLTKRSHSQWAAWRVPPEVRRGASTLILHCFGGGSPLCSTFSFPPKITFLFHVKSVILPNIQECRCQCSAPGRGVVEQVHLRGPAPPSRSFGQERRAEEKGLGQGKGKGESLLRAGVCH